MCNSTAIPDKFLTMSRLPKWGDENKVLSGVSQSQKGVDLIWILKYWLCPSAVSHSLCKREDNIMIIIQFLCCLELLGLHWLGLRRMGWDHSFCTLLQYWVWVGVWMCWDGKGLEYYLYINLVWIWLTCGFGVFLKRSFYSYLLCDQNKCLVMPNGQVMVKNNMEKISSKCGL